MRCVVIEYKIVNVGGIAAAPLPAVYLAIVGFDEVVCMLAVSAVRSKLYAHESRFVFTPATVDTKDSFGSCLLHPLPPACR